MDGGGLLDGAFGLTCCGVACDSLFCFFCRGSKVQCQRAQVVCGCVGVRVWECGCRPASMQARHAHTSRVSMRVSWCLCMCICGSVCVDAHVCTFVSLYLGTCPYVCLCKCMSLCTCCVCVCVRAREH